MMYRSVRSLCCTPPETDVNTVLTILEFKKMDMFADPYFRESGLYLFRVSSGFTGRVALSSKLNKNLILGMRMSRHC